MIILPSTRGFPKKSAFSFTPAQLSGLELWVRGDQGFTAGTATTKAQWTDLSGKGRNLIANANGSTAITYNASTGCGKPSIYFGQFSNAYMQTSSNMPALTRGSYLIVVVFRMSVSSPGAFAALYGQGTTTKIGYLAQTDGYNLQDSTGSGYGINSILNAYSTSQLTNLEIIESVSSTSFRSHNNFWGTTTITTSMAAPSAALGYLAAAERGGTGYGFATYFGELIVCSSYTAADITNLKKYLNNYWNSYYKFP